MPSATRPSNSSKSTLPLLQPYPNPKNGEELFIYLATSAIAMSISLVRADEDRRQKPFYFVSNVFSDAKPCYMNFERIALALRVVAKKLCPYFQAHTINVLSNYPIRVIRHKPDALSRLLKSAIELSEFDIILPSEINYQGSGFGRFYCQIV